MRLRRGPSGEGWKVVSNRDRDRFGEWVAGQGFEPKVATKASAALRDGRSSARTKSIAASVVSQAKGSRKK